MKRVALLGCLALALATPTFAQNRQPTHYARLQDDKLVITPRDNGDRIVDFSHAGYAGANAPIPTIDAKVVVRPIDGDATALIQASIDQVGAMDADERGFRGAVLLAPGTFRVSGQIRLNRSGVVLRGSGIDQTTLLATGYDRRALVRIAGVDDRTLDTAHTIEGDYTPAGTTELRIAAGHDLKVGDTVLVTRPCTDEWTVAMGMNDFGGDRHGVRWNPNSRVLNWDRTITAVDGNTVTLDVPITAGLDARFGGGTIARYSFPGRVERVGIENLSLVSAHDDANPVDEDHAWVAIAIDNARDAWVRRVCAEHFVSYAVAVFGNAARVTVEDSLSLAPTGEVGGWRRRAFYVEGQQVLMQRLISEHALHDFAVGHVAAGPNAFVECESRGSLGASGAIDSWANGALFDRIRLDGGRIELKNLSYLRQGAGWSAANSVIWNSAAGVIECWSPPGHTNYAVGTRGEFSGDGVWWASDDGSDIDSLYHAQLRSRLGDAAPPARFVPNLPSGSRSTTPEQANQLVELSRTPARTVNDLIVELITASPIPVSADNLPEAAAPPQAVRAPTKPLAIRNGWLVVGDELLTGTQSGVPWWSGRVRAPHVSRNRAITRFVPGLEGTGFTDDLNAVAVDMSERNIGALVQHPPLWYERRRDDHQRVRRADAEVVAPFYEWPFARSGQGRAFDGLSKWDLTKPNQYYYLRLRGFADAAAQHGIVLFNEHYMQHNILEAGGHYTDFPWRPANNINDTGLPEPIAYAGDKLIYLGELFYDVANNPKLRALHRQYIRTQLQQLADSPNVIHMTSEEFTGSLGFMQFWLDTIGEWERETGRDAIVALYATKDVTDAILADAERSKIVEVIYSRYNTPDGWWYTGDSVWAPPGGQNLAPRQWQRQGRAGNASPKDVARAIREYRGKHPEKAFVYVGGNSPDFGWATLLAGGSMPPLELSDAAFARVVPNLKRVSDTTLADDEGNTVAYSERNSPLKLTLPAGHRYIVRHINPADGRLVESPQRIEGGDVEIAAPGFAPYAAWIGATP